MRGAVPLAVQFECQCQWGLTLVRVISSSATLAGQFLEPRPPHHGVVGRTEQTCILASESCSKWRVNVLSAQSPRKMMLSLSREVQCQWMNVATCSIGGRLEAGARRQAAGKPQARRSTLRVVQLRQSRIQSFTLRKKPRRSLRFSRNASATCSPHNFFHLLGCSARAPAYDCSSNNSQPAPK